jgi:hypothetical protein
MPAMSKIDRLIGKAPEVAPRLQMASSAPPSPAQAAEMTKPRICVLATLMPASEAAISSSRTAEKARADPGQPVVCLDRGRRREGDRYSLVAREVVIGELWHGKTECKGDTGEVRTSQSRCGCSDEAAGGGREHGGEGEPDCQWQMWVVGLDVGVGVRTDRHEGGVAEGDLPGPADEERQPGDDDGVGGDLRDVEVGEARDLDGEQVAGDAGQERQHAVAQEGLTRESEPQATGAGRRGRKSRRWSRSAGVDGDLVHFRPSSAARS